MSGKSYDSYNLMASTYIPTVISPEVSFNLDSSDTEHEEAPIRRPQTAGEPSCSDWSQWRIKLNNTMIRAMARRDHAHSPTPRISVRRRICDAAISRAVRDKSPTFMRFEMDPESFLSFGIPRARVSRKDTSTTEHIFMRNDSTRRSKSAQQTRHRRR